MIAKEHLFGPIVLTAIVHSTVSCKAMVTSVATTLIILQNGAQIPI
eukprot:gene32971-44115_t